MQVHGGNSGELDHEVLDELYPLTVKIPRGVGLTNQKVTYSGVVEICFPQSGRFDARKNKMSWYSKARGYLIPQSNDLWKGGWREAFISLHHLLYIYILDSLPIIPLRSSSIHRAQLQ